MRATLWLTLAVWTAAAVAAADLPSATLAWQSSDPIIPANFDAYFPDDEAAAKRLDEAPSRNPDNPGAAELIPMIRQGLRRAERQAGNEWIRWLGQRLVWGRQDSQPDPHAVELVYHASAHRAYQYEALYYGLSRVDKKTPAVLRRMVEIAMGSDDWINVVGHTAWAAKDNKEEMISFVAPYLASDDPAVRAHAQALKRIYAGEVTAHDHWKEIHTKRATAEFGSQMDRLRRRFTEGDSEARRELLGTIQNNFLWLIMDDSWIDAFQAAASDPDVRVRRDAAAQLCTRWFWERKPGDPVNQGAFDLLIKMSNDTDRDVRYNVSRMGLGRLPESEVAQARMRAMQAEDVEREFVKARQHALTAIEQGRFQDVESMLEGIRPGMEGNVPEEVRQKVTQFVKEMEGLLAEGRRPKGELQRRIDQAEEGAVIDLGEGAFDGPILIEKPLTLRGAGLDQTVVKHQGDAPAVMIRSAQGVRLERLTVRWAPASTGAKIEYPAAVAARDARVVLHSVALEPIDRPQLTPYGLMAAGRADVQFLEGRSRGFAYALIWLDGAGGKVMDSDLRGAGHSVVTVHPESQVEVARNLLADCGYHAVRVTGGTVDMHDNIVMGCTRAGVYLGNRDAHGRIYQNLFTGNLGEIWGYYGSDTTIDHNVFFQSKDPAVIFWNTCALEVRANSFTANPAALRQYVQVDDPAKVGVRLEGNHYWGNKEATEPGRKAGANPGVDGRFQLEKSATAIEGDPKFRDPISGDFTPMEGSVLLQGNRTVAGLLNPQAIHDLALRHKLRFAPLAISDSKP